VPLLINSRIINRSYLYDKNNSFAELYELTINDPFNKGKYMKRFLMIILMSSLTHLAMANEAEDTITNQQRCEEWFLIDGIDDENKADYMAECLSNLQYEDDSNEESATVED
jgi:hypothetical protein